MLLGAFVFAVKFPRRPRGVVGTCWSALPWLRVVPRLPRRVGLRPLAILAVLGMAAVATMAGGLVSGAMARAFEVSLPAGAFLGLAGTDFRNPLRDRNLEVLRLLAVVKVRQAHA